MKGLTAILLNKLANTSCLDLFQTVKFGIVAPEIHENSYKILGNSSCTVYFLQIDMCLDQVIHHKQNIY